MVLAGNCRERLTTSNLMVAYVAASLTFLGSWNFCIVQTVTTTIDATCATQTSGLCRLLIIGRTVESPFVAYDVLILEVE